MTPGKSKAFDATSLRSIVHRVSRVTDSHVGHVTASNLSLSTLDDTSNTTLGESEGDWTVRLGRKDVRSAFTITEILAEYQGRRCQLLASMIFGSGKGL